MNVSERRENPRNKINADVRVITPEASLSAMLMEISYGSVVMPEASLSDMLTEICCGGGGIRIQAEKSINPGIDIKVCISQPHNGETVLHGKVIWALELPGPEQKICQMGIEIYEKSRGESDDDIFADLTDNILASPFLSVS